jgi:transglycosylase-like protein with SLT domain
MQLDRVRRTALAVAVLSAVGAIAASAGATATPPTSDPTSIVNADGGTSTGASGGSASGATGSTAADGATGTTGTTGATGASGPSGATGAVGTTGPTGSSGSSATTGAGESNPGAPATAVGPTGAGGVGGPAEGASGAAGSNTGGGGASSKPLAVPVVTGSSAQPQSGAAGGANASNHPHSSSPGGSSSVNLNGPTAPSPALFGGSNPLAGVLPGSWDDPFIVNGAADVPQFYVESFHIPPFLLSIYQAAGTAYGIPWETLAAINEVETDYGTDLDTSSAGAIGWMQFLPHTWGRFGVDASASGVRDPYNAADAIFAAARYLAAAGGTHNLPAAIFAYNHSHTYVRSVLLRAELLAGEPSALLNSVSELAEGDFPVQLRYHASYRPVAVVPAATASGVAGRGSSGAAPAPSAAGAVAAPPATSAPAEEIFASSEAAVVAAQDGTIVAIGRSRALGRYVVLRNGFGDRFTYGNLGSVSAWFPARKPPRASSALLSSAAPAGLAPGPRPTAPASAGAQSSGSSPTSKLYRQARAQAAAASVSSAPLVATVNLSSRPSPSTLTTPLAVLVRALRATLAHTSHSVLARYFTGAFGLRPDQLVLEPLRVGSHVLAGTILGRLRRTAGSRRPHLVFELRPAGVAEAPIDPRPFLDAWSQLETLELHRDSFNSPFYGPNLHADSVGAVLLMSQLDVERAVLEDAHVTLPACERAAIADGSVDRRVLAALEVLVLHGIDPAVNGAWCGGGTHERTSPAVLKTGNAIALASLDGQPAGTVAEVAIRALDALHGAARPTLSERTAPGDLVISFAPERQPEAIAAAAAFTSGFALSATRWSELDSRLVQIREPRVPTAISAAALPVLAAHPSARRTSRHTAAG